MFLNTIGTGTAYSFSATYWYGGYSQGVPVQITLYHSEVCILTWNEYCFSMGSEYRPIWQTVTVGWVRWFVLPLAPEHAVARQCNFALRNQGTKGRSGSVGYLSARLASASLCYGLPRSTWFISGVRRYIHHFSCIKQDNISQYTIFWCQNGT